jgi:hypothetical protein
MVLALLRRYVYGQKNRLKLFIWDTLVQLVSFSPLTLYVISLLVLPRVYIRSSPTVPASSPTVTEDNISETSEDGLLANVNAR